MLLHTQVAQAHTYTRFKPSKQIAEHKHARLAHLASTHDPCNQTLLRAHKVHLASKGLCQGFHTLCLACPCWAIRVASIAQCHTLQFAVVLVAWSTACRSSLQQAKLSNWLHEVTYQAWWSLAKVEGGLQTTFAQWEHDGFLHKTSRDNIGHACRIGYSCWMHDFPAHGSSAPCILVQLPIRCMRKHLIPE